MAMIKGPKAVETKMGRASARRGMQVGGTIPALLLLGTMKEWRAVETRIGRATPRCGMQLGAWSIAHAC